MWTHVSPSHIVSVQPASPSERLGLHSKRRPSDKPGIKCRIKPTPMFALQKRCIRCLAGQDGSKQTSFNFSNVVISCLMKRRAWDVGEEKGIGFFFYLPLYTLLYYLFYFFSLTALISWVHRKSLLKKKQNLKYWVFLPVKNTEQQNLTLKGRPKPAIDFRE